MTDTTRAGREALEREIEDLRTHLDICRRRVRDLRDAEDVAGGVVYAREIFATQQEKLRLDAEIDIRERRLRRMAME